MYDFPETIALSNGASRFLDITDSLGHSSSPGGWGRRILDVSRRYLPIKLCNIFITPPLSPLLAVDLHSIFHSPPFLLV